MTYVQLSSLNLNQLVALDALLSERNVRRAALRMGVTQSAMSHTLRALRELLGDPLLVRVGNQMVPTDYAGEIGRSLRRGLSELENVVRGRAAFRPESIRDEFTLATYDGIAAFLLPHLYRRVHERAPHAQLKIAPVDTPKLHQELLRGDVDVALVAPFINLDGLETEPILGGDSVVLLRKDHPKIKQKLSLTQFCETPHAMMSLAGQGPGFVDHLLEPLGKTRHVSVRVPYLLALPELLATSDLLAIVARPAARFFCEHWPLKMLPLPFASPAAAMVVCWHERFSAEPAARFFRDQVRRAVDELKASRG